MMDYNYFAFISYKREDEQWASWLQHKLEHYKLPTNLNGRTDLPKEIRPVFKDTSELMPGNLPEQICQALEQSRYLIVICSPRSAQSEWVNKEIETYMSMGRTSNIIPFIIEGHAFSENAADECFPTALRQLPEEQEILGANINEMGRDAAAVKVVARMFDIQFDTLWQRHEREKRRQRNIVIATAAAFVMMVIGVAGWIWHQNVALTEKNHQVLQEQSRFIAETASRLAEHGENYMACRLALEVLLNNPYTPEAETALRKAWEGEGTSLCDSIGAGEAIVSPDGKWVAASTFDTVRLWDVNSGSLIFEISMGEEHVNDIVFDATGTVLQAKDIRDHVIQWDIPEGTMRNETVAIPRRQNVMVEVYDMDTYFSKPMAMTAVYSPDSSMIAVACVDGYAQVWDTATRQCIYEIDAEDVRVNSVDFFPDNKRLLLATEHFVRIYDLPTYRSYLLLNATDNLYTPMWKLEFSPDSRQLMAASGDMKIRCWDVTTGSLLWEKENPESLEDDEELGNQEAMSPDGKTMAVAVDESNVFVYNTENDCPIWHLHTADPHDVHAMVSSIAYSPDCQYIAVGSTNGDLRVYEYHTLQQLMDETRERFKNHPLTPEERRKYYLE